MTPPDDAFDFIDHLAERLHFARDEALSLLCDLLKDYRPSRCYEIRFAPPGLQ